MVRMTIAKAINDWYCFKSISQNARKDFVDIVSAKSLQEKLDECLVAEADRFEFILKTYLSILREEIQDSSVLSWKDSCRKIVHECLGMDTSERQMSTEQKLWDTILSKHLESYKAELYKYRGYSMVFGDAGQAAADKIKGVKNNVLHCRTNLLTQYIYALEAGIHGKVVDCITSELQEAV